MAKKKYDQFTNEPLTQEELTTLKNPPHKFLDKLI